MKFFIVVILTALLGFAAPLFFTWWSFAVTSFVVAAFIPQKAGFAFLAGFLGLFLLWGLLAMYIDSVNGHLLSQKIAVLLPLNGSSISLILVTALIGGLVSGFAALSGSLVRKPLT